MSLRITRALVTGIGGQDGAWLAAHLLRDDVEVVGTHRPASPAGNWRLDELGLSTHRRLRLLSQ